MNPGMARLRRIERQIVRRSRSWWARFCWKVSVWLFGMLAAVAVCALVMCVAAERTERVPGQGLYSNQALEIMK